MIYNQKIIQQITNIIQQTATYLIVNNGIQTTNNLSSSKIKLKRGFFN